MISGVLTTIFGHNKTPNSAQDNHKNHPKLHNQELNLHFNYRNNCNKTGPKIIAPITNAIIEASKTAPAATSLAINAKI